MRLTGHHFLIKCSKIITNNNGRACEDRTRDKWIKSQSMRRNKYLHTHISIYVTGL